MEDWKERLLDLYKEISVHEEHIAGCRNRISEIRKEIKKIEDEAIERARGGEA